MCRRNIHRSFFLIVFLTLFSCGKTTSPFTGEKIVKMNLGSEPHTLDPRLSRDANSQILMRMFFEGLTRVGPKNEPELALALGCEISEDLKTYVFTLKEAKWSNGQPIKAQDFAYAWKKILSPNFLSDNAYQLFLIKNAKPVKEGSLPIEELGILTPDEHTLIIELEYPAPYILESLASPYFFPVHQETDEKDPSWAMQSDTYVCNGPFILEKWKHNNFIIAKKNPKYWDAKNLQIDGISFIMVDSDTEMKLFEKGELHWAGSPLSHIPLDSIAHLKEELCIQPRDETAFLRMNISIKPLHCSKFRKALAFAINRKEIVEHILQGNQLPACGFVPPSMQLKKEPYFVDGSYEKAKSLLEEALLELKITKEELPSIKLSYIQERHVIAQAIQQQWHAILGLKVQLEALERKVFFDQLSHLNYDIALSSWGADFHDPVNFLEVFKYRSQSTNNTNWEDIEYAKTLTESFGFLDQDKRYALLAHCEEILMDAMPIIPLYHYSMLYRKDRALEDVFLSSLGNLDFKWANLQNAH